MKFSLFFLLLVIFSCQNNTNRVLIELVNQNEYLIKEVERNLYADFETAKLDKQISTINEIDKWIQITLSIDSLYNEIYHFNSDSYDMDLINNETSNTLQLKLFKLIQDSTGKVFLKDQIAKDVSLFFKKDSLFFEEIYKSKIGRVAKEQLLYNYLKFQKLQLKKYCYYLCPKSNCGLKYIKTSIIAIADKPVLLKGDTVTIFAGVGEFKSNSFPKIFINNQQVDLKSDNMAALKLETNLVGKYKIPIKIVNNNIDGTTTKYEKEVSYEVVNKFCK